MRSHWLALFLLLACSLHGSRGFVHQQLHRAHLRVQRLNALAKVSDLFKRKSFPAEAALPIPVDPASEIYVKVLHNITNGCMLVA